jgi:hypothetical protein
MTTPHYEKHEALLKLVALEPIEELHAAAVCGWPGDAFDVALKRLLVEGRVRYVNGRNNQRMTHLALVSYQ